MNPEGGHEAVMCTGPPHWTIRIMGRPGPLLTGDNR